MIITQKLLDIFNLMNIPVPHPEPETAHYTHMAGVLDPEYKRTFCKLAKLFLQDVCASLGISAYEIEVESSNRFMPAEVRLHSGSIYILLSSKKDDWNRGLDIMYKVSCNRDSVIKWISYESVNEDYDDFIDRIKEAIMLNAVKLKKIDPFYYLKPYLHSILYEARA